MVFSPAAGCPVAVVGSAGGTVGLIAAATVAVGGTPGVGVIAGAVGVGLGTGDAGGGSVGTTSVKGVGAGVGSLPLGPPIKAEAQYQSSAIKISKPMTGSAIRR
jgi:hypothetical protein